MGSRHDIATSRSSTHITYIASMNSIPNEGLRLSNAGFFCFPSCRHCQIAIVYRRDTPLQLRTS